MSEDSVLLQIEEKDVDGAKNSEDFNENEEKVSSEFEEFAQYWRLSLGVSISILQYLQYKYLNELLSKKDVTNFASKDWRKYHPNWNTVLDISNFLLNYLKNKQTNNALERDQKIKDIKYVNDLIYLLKDVWQKERNILTPLPPVPELDLQETASIIEYKGNERIFHVLLHFYVIVYKLGITDYIFSKRFKKSLENISSKRQQFDDFIRNFLINQKEGNEEVFQRWEEMQQFLTNYFNIEPNPTEEAPQCSQFYQVLQSLLRDELKWRNKILQLLNNRHYQIHIHNSFWDFSEFFEDDDVEQLFLILLLDIKFDLKNFIKYQESIIQRTLNGNFLKHWRRIMDVPIKLMQFQQYQIHYWNLEEIKSDERATEKEKVKAIGVFKDIVEKISDYVVNISIRMEILKNTSIMELDQNKFIQGLEYFNNLLKILKEIDNDERIILFPLPSIPNLNAIDVKHSPTNGSKRELNDIIFNLYHFFKLINENSTLDFCHWNKEMLENISKNLHYLNDFICNYIKNQYDEEDVLLLWEKFQIFLGENKNVDNNVLETEINKQNRFIELNELIFDINHQWEFELPSISPEDLEKTMKYDKIKEMEIYIILLLNVNFDAGVFVRNNMDLNSNIIAIKILFQFLLRHFECNIIPSIILHSDVDVNLVVDVEKINGIVNYLQVLLIKYNGEKDFPIYNNLITQFEIILKDIIKLDSIEILEMIENMHQSISNLNPDENVNEKQTRILYNLYYFWRMFIKRKDNLKNDFFQWNETMFLWVFLHINKIDSIINRFANEDESISEMWKCLKKFLTKKYTGHQSENESDHNVNFELFLNDNSSFSEEMEMVLNFINMDSLEISLESEILYILILLDFPCSLKQMADFVCEYNMSIAYDDLNKYKFNYFTLLNDFNINARKLFYFFFRKYEDLHKNFNKYLYTYKSLNKDNLNILDWLKEMKNMEIKDDVLYLNEIPRLPTYNFQLKLTNNLFLIQYYQILYLIYYFEIIQIDDLEGKSFVEKIQDILEYIYLNCEKMDELINSYFGYSENANVFRSNWNLIKEMITNLSLKDFNNSWQLLFIDFEKYFFKKYFKRHELYNSDLIININEKSVIAKDVLLILLNVPLSEISKIQYLKPFTLDELFFYMIQYKKLLPTLNGNERYILAQYDLTMDEFLRKLENVSNASEDGNESSTLLVKSEFNYLEKQEKTAIIDNLVNIVHSKNTHGYFIIIFKILSSALPLIDIFLDIILAIKFFFSNEIIYCNLTIGILLITGIATVTAERILKSEIQWKPTYYVKILNIDKWKYLLSFTQITLFLRALNEALLRLKIKRKKNNSYLEYINYGDPEFLKKETQTLKYVEMCFEAIPQTILQLYIILSIKEWGIFQIVSIFTSICNINVGVWTYLSTRDPENELEVLKNKRLILREFCFYSARIISTSLMSSLFSWVFLTSWIGFHITMDLLLILIKRCGFFQDYFKISSISNFKFMKAIHTDFPRTKKSIWNYITLIEFLIFTAICSVYVHIYLKEVDDHLIFVILFFIYICLFITWAFLSNHIILNGFLLLLEIILLPIYLILLTLRAVGLINHICWFEDDDFY